MKAITLPKRNKGEQKVNHSRNASTLRRLLSASLALSLAASPVLGYAQEADVPAAVETDAPYEGTVSALENTIIPKPVMVQESDSSFRINDQTKIAADDVEDVLNLAGFLREKLASTGYELPLAQEGKAKMSFPCI